MTHHLHRLTVTKYTPPFPATKHVISALPCGAYCSCFSALRHAHSAEVVCTRATLRSSRCEPSHPTLMHCTEGRRSLRIPQLLAVEAPPDVAWRPVQCINVGWDGRDVQWRCETHDMLLDLKFGRMEVNCEGYESPDDEYVLEGSCGLEYELLRNRPVPTAHYTYESSPPFTHKPVPTTHYTYESSPPFTRKDAAAFFLVIALIAAAATICIFVSWVLECCCNSAHRVVTHTDVYEDTPIGYHTGPPPAVFARSPPVVVAPPPVVYPSTPPARRPVRRVSSAGSTPTRKATGFATTGRR